MTPFKKVLFIGSRVLALPLFILGGLFIGICLFSIGSILYHFPIMQTYQFSRVGQKVVNEIEQEKQKENRNEQKIMFLYEVLYQMNLIMDGENYKMTKKTVDEALQFQPNNSSFLAKKALVLSGKKENNLEEIQKISEQALKIDPNNESAYYGLSKYYLENNQTHKLKECIDKILDVNPLSLWGNIYLTQVYVNQGEQEKAKNLLNYVYCLNPNIIFDKQLFLRRLVSLNKDSQNMIITNNQGQQNDTNNQNDYKLNQFQAGLMNYEMLMNNSKDYDMLGAVVDPKFYFSSLDSFSNEIKQNKCNLDAYFFKAQSFYGLGQVKQAIDTLKEGISNNDQEFINQNGNHLRYLLGKLQTEIGENIQAQEYINEAIQNEKDKYLKFLLQQDQNSGLKHQKIFKFDNKSIFNNYHKVVELWENEQKIQNQKIQI
ncbi:hypothetical protein PPERSA_06119 [Pseudocohnilembus persalinus]|uniref:Tetratricopeptide repeat protein n=1 Tax=Pseudocohnilembus persalinus TaxID=266149 RepID=A0A0V0QVW9_PSEPJ|nr:hypothetical protein PPERSA_06119 [Pseudocohnilembus persalinus]|eukprot:KRX06237.1 hypothetical protein PPERSA_06119 [Pseudocohnilembus persalinus]